MKYMNGLGSNAEIMSQIELEMQKTIPPKGIFNVFYWEHGSNYAQRFYPINK